MCLCIVWIRILNKLLSVLKKWWTMKTNSWLCVYIILVVFLGCRLFKWMKRTRRSWNKKKIWSIVAGQRINSIFFQFWICYPRSHSLCEIFEVNRRVFFSNERWDSLCLWIWFPEVQHRMENAWIQNETKHTKPPWTGQQQHVKSREKQFYIYIECIYSRLYTHIHIYIYVYQWRWLHIAIQIEWVRFN